MKNKLKYIAFDADDTLWENEPYFKQTEQKFFKIMERFISADELNKKLYKVEMDNLANYGYGIKAFILSLIETAINVSKNNLQITEVSEIIKLGKGMINSPLIVINGVEDVLKKLSGKYKLLVATKGDLLDQERKLKKSNLAKYFHHIEVMSDKKEANYRKLLKQLEIEPEEFLMIGNSIKSDVLPVIKIGGFAAHVPFHTTWIHEKIKDDGLDKDCCYKLKNISEILDLL